MGKSLPTVAEVIAMFDSVRCEADMSKAKRAGARLPTTVQLDCCDAAIAARRRLRCAFPDVGNIAA